MKKVIVVGLDGLEPRIVEPMLATGDLPHLARLRQMGGYARVRTTYPAQTPVAWSTFATGVNPGGHGIFDFVGRDLKTYLPTNGLSRYEQKNAFVPPKAINLRRGTPMWDLLSKAGIASTILRCPCTYPPDSIRGQMLAGVGVPDLRGGLGTSAFYTTADGIRARESEHVIRVQPDAAATLATHLVGPRDPRSRSDIRFDITIHLEPAARRVTIRSDGQPRALEVREGEWSSWLKVKFRVGPLVSVRALVRFYLVSLTPVFELYGCPLNFDPEQPLFPISSPQDYAAELAERVGTFYTAGMAEDHGGLNNGRIGDEAFLDQCRFVLREREAMMRSELERFRAGLFFCLFDTPDRLQHMFWRYREPGHPALAPQAGGPVSGEMRAVVEEHYRQCDAIIGRALEYADDQTLFIVLSDHGMSSFQRGLHLNTWLYENGFLALRNGLKPGAEAGDFFHGVDWSRTQAYAVGLGGVYLNLNGREEQGIVAPDQAEAVKAAITYGLAGLADRQRGSVAVRSVKVREQIYAGPYVSDAPDLLVNFAEGYRVSWATPLGSVPAGLFEDNVKKWSGDHIIDPALAPGVLFVNRPFRDEGASLLDLAPTILAALGVPTGPAMEGSSLLP